MTWRDRLILGGGAVAALAAVVVAFSPWVPPAIDSFGSAISSQGLVILLALSVALIALLASYRSTEVSGVEPPFSTPPEQPANYDVPQAGDDIDGPLESVRNEKGTLSVGAYKSKKRSVRLQLREAAVEVLADAEGITSQSARQRIEDGEWTDDPRAAAFLGGEVTQPPLEMRVSDWLSGHSFQRRVDATIAEIRALAELPSVERDDGDDDTSAVHSRDEQITADDVPETNRSGHTSATVTTADADTRSVSRWELGVTVAFLLSGLGFFASNVTLVLGSVVALTYAVYGYATRPPAMTLELTRAVTDTSPVPGESVEVTLTVENVGQHPIPEVRVVDGVPEALPIESGSPRACDTLRPEESVTLRYTVEALRGDHGFDPTTVWTRNVSGEIEREATATLDTGLTCRDPLEEVPLSRQTTPYTGRIPTDDGGQGVEFFSTREYQSTDPLKQIDWNFWARTGEPRTIEFRQNRAATVVVLLDDRPEARQSRHEWSADAVGLGQYAAVRMADAMLDESNAVGVASLAQQDLEAPGRGREQLRAIQRFLEDTRAEDDDEDDTETENSTRVGRRSGPPRSSRMQLSTNSGLGAAYMYDGGSSIRWLRKRVESDVQIVFVTPLLDDEPVWIARRLKAEGHAVTMLSPDMTTTETPGSTVAHIRRRERLRELRSRSVRIADWPSESPLSVALERAQHRWSA